MALIDVEPYSKRIIGCAIEVHKTLGPGLLESIYESALCHELFAAGLAFVRQKKLPVIYKGQPLDCELRMDLVVEDAVIVEIKSIQNIMPLHEAQLLTYLKVSGLHAGLLLNFNEARLTDGIRRRLL
jgi:GxxExxY protein